MIPAEIIQKKRDGIELTAEEIQNFVQSFTKGEIADYQATAFLMATYFKGMSKNETVALTQAMIQSGEKYDFSTVEGPKVDKHSTGGVGDKVSLILAPLAAACGLVVPMMAGRGLGHSGGTLDKLESIPGFKFNLPSEKFRENLLKIGTSIIGQSETIAPADRKFYALRDVTATIECIPLIVGSILSKKIAEGTEALVLDVKVGNGAFMTHSGEAKKLARAITGVAKKLGIKCRALLTDMNQPLGYTVGNTLEVIESIEILTGSRSSLSSAGSADLRELTLRLCSHMLQLSGKVSSLPAGYRLATSKLTDGSAWALFKKMIAAQGGDPRTLEHTELLPLSENVLEIESSTDGYLSRINTKAVGQALVELGGGRKKASDRVDHSVGFVFHKKLGHKVKRGEKLISVFSPKNASDELLKEIEKVLKKSLTFSKGRKPVPPLILDPPIE